MQSTEKVDVGDILSSIGSYLWILYDHPDPLSKNHNLRWEPETLATVIEKDFRNDQFVKVLTSGGTVGWAPAYCFRLQR